MKNKKTKTVKIKGNKSFIGYILFMIFVFVASIILSVCDLSYSMVEWPEHYSDVIGVSSQIITAIITLVVSIIGIAISLQNEEFFGVKITKLYALRIRKHYSILAIIIISIALCMINLSFYMIGLNFAAIGTVIVAILFLLQVLFLEVPIMSKKEEAILNIIKDNMIFCYTKKCATSKELKDSIKYLLYRKTLKETYIKLNDKEDIIYNKYLLMELLDIQQHLAFEIKDSYDDYQQRTIAHSLLENVFDIMFHHLNMDDSIYDDIEKNRHLLTRVLFRIHELPSMEETFRNKIQGVTQCLEFASADTQKWDGLLSEILIILVSHTIQNGDFSIIKAVRHQLSSSEYCLDRKSPILNVFAVISMYLYYLRNCDSDVPDEIKIKIDEFINEEGMIEEKTKIFSWKTLFSRASEEFLVEYDKLIELSKKTSHDMEYFLYGIGAKYVVLDERFFSTWYIANLFNAQRVYDIDYTELCTQYPSIKEQLKEFGKKCLDSDGKFCPTNEVERMVSFYKDEKEHFVLFKIGEERHQNLFNFINSLLLEELTIETIQAKQVDNDAFANKIHSSIDSAVKSEWGFDSTIQIENDSRYFSVFFEKMPQAINFEETICKYCVDSVLDDLSKSVHKTVIYNDETFEKNVRQILEKTPKYTTANTKKTIPYFYIHTEDLQKKFLNLNETMNEIESRIIGNMFFVINDAFSFNFEIEKVEISELSDEDVDKKVASYQRADGQFVYEGVFLPKETITEFVKDRFAVLTVIIKHQINSSSELVYELKPYAKKP